MIHNLINIKMVGLHRCAAAVRSRIRSRLGKGCRICPAGRPGGLLPGPGGRPSAGTQAGTVLFGSLPESLSQAVHGYSTLSWEEKWNLGFLAALADDTSDPVSYVFRCGIGASAMGTPSQRASLRLQ